MASEKQETEAVSLERVEDLGFRKQVLTQAQTPTTVTLGLDWSGLDLQGAIRTYLVRKDLDHTDFPELHCEPWLHTEERANPTTLLSSKALATLQRLPKLNLERSVTGAVALPAQRLQEGDIYEGEWSLKWQVPRGRGRLYCSDGSYSEGYWRSGELHLFGRVIYSNGDYYEGQYEQSQRAGQGHFETFDGLCVYEGQWQDDMRSGEGKERYANGSRYQGDFAHDIKNGRGTIWWPDGSSYEGDLVNEQLTGKGTYRWADGRIYSGDWLQGQMHGQGRFTYADGKSYVGSYLHDRKNGHGVYCWGNHKYDGEWLEGQMHGFGEISTLNGNAPKKRYEYRNGVRLREVL